MPFFYNLKWFKNISASLTNFLFFLTAEGNKSLAHNKSWGAEVNRPVKYPVENKKKRVGCWNQKKEERFWWLGRQLRETVGQKCPIFESKWPEKRVKVTRKASQSDPKSESKWPEKLVKVTRKASQSDPKSESNWPEKMDSTCLKNW